MPRIKRQHEDDVDVFKSNNNEFGNYNGNRKQQQQQQFHNSSSSSNGSNQRRNTNGLNRKGTSNYKNETTGGCLSSYNSVSGVQVLGSCAWTQVIAEKHEIKANKIKEKQNELLQRWEYYTEQYESKEDDKWQKFKSLQQTLRKFDEIGWKRSSHQRQFHRAFLIASLKKIFGSDLPKYTARLLKEFRLSELRSDVVVNTPRRFGKTIGTAMFAAAWMFTQPGTVISIYSPGKRASKKLLAQIYNMVLKLAGGNNSLIPVYNIECMIYQFPDGRTAECWSYPSSVAICDIFIFHFFYLFIYLITWLPSHTNNLCFSFIFYISEYFNI